MVSMNLKFTIEMKLVAICRVDSARQIFFYTPSLRGIAFDVLADTRYSPCNSVAIYLCLQSLTYTDKPRAPPPLKQRQIPTSGHGEYTTSQTPLLAPPRDDAMFIRGLHLCNPRTQGHHSADFFRVAGVGRVDGVDGVERVSYPCYPKLLYLPCLL